MPSRRGWPHGFFGEASPARIEAMKRTRIGIVGDFNPGYISHRETGIAVEDSGQRLVRSGQLTATVVVPSNTGPAIKMVADALRSGVPVPAQVLLPPASFPEIHELGR